jgi:hypothetical protein
MYLVAIATVFVPKTGCDLKRFEAAAEKRVSEIERARFPNEVRGSEVESREEVASPERPIPFFRCIRLETLPL